MPGASLMPTCGRTCRVPFVRDQRIGRSRKTCCAGDRRGTRARGAAGGPYPTTFDRSGPDRAGPPTSPSAFEDHERSSSTPSGGLLNAYSNTFDKMACPPPISTICYPQWYGRCPARDHKRPRSSLTFPDVRAHSFGQASRAKPQLSWGVHSGDQVADRSTRIKRSSPRQPAWLRGFLLRTSGRLFHRRKLPIRPREHRTGTSSPLNSAPRPAPPIHRPPD